MAHVFKRASTLVSVLVALAFLPGGPVRSTPRRYDPNRAGMHGAATRVPNWAESTDGSERQVSPLRERPRAGIRRGDAVDSANLGSPGADRVATTASDRRLRPIRSALARGGDREDGDPLAA